MRWLLLFALCAVASAQPFRVGDPTFGHKRAAEEGGQTFLIDEGFEGTGYEESWTETTGTPNEDYTDTVLSGSQSLYMNGTAASQSTDSSNIGDQTDFWIKFKFRPLTLPGAGREIIRFMLNGAQSGSSELQIDASGRLVLLNGTASATTAAGMSVGNTYDVWIHFVAGSGANGIALAAWAAVGSSRPTATGAGVGYILKIDCNGTAAVDQHRVTAQFSTTGPEYIMDDLQVATDEIP